jgi:hypothetical protein
VLREVATWQLGAGSMARQWRGNDAAPAHARHWANELYEGPSLHSPASCHAAKTYLWLDVILSPAQSDLDDRRGDFRLGQVR